MICAQWGQRAKRPDSISAFMVTDTRADNLQMTVDEVTHQVNSWSEWKIQLFDPAGHDVRNANGSLSH